MKLRLCLCASVVALAGFSACTDQTGTTICRPGMNEYQTMGSHNSYKRAIPPIELELIRAQAPEWAEALNYAHIAISDQLDLGLQQIELDVFHDPEGGLYATPLLPQLSRQGFDAAGLTAPGFKVLHVQDVDARSSCNPFIACLEQIRDWSAANFRHDPILILINAKQAPIDLPNATVPLAFDAAAFDALDAEIRSVFGPQALISPDDVRGEHATLREAVTTAGWPYLDDVTTKVFFALDEGPEVVDVYRRGRDSLQGLAMFVNSHDPTAADAAYFTINDPRADGETIAERVRQGFIVRTRADADTREARTGDRARLDAALASGAQYISTDYYLPRTEWSEYVAELPEQVADRPNPVANCAMR
ncbi:MAG: Ca2+-dependent phosphoinositide-specific phospholipase C [Pseudomonadota bacterium]